MSEIQAAFLWAQLERAEDMLLQRVASWAYYEDQLTTLAGSGSIELPVVPKDCESNGHIFYIKVPTSLDQEKVLAHLARQGIEAAFHYVPLHSSQAGRRFGSFHGEDLFTTKERNRLIRLPLYHGITQKDQDLVVQNIKSYFS